MRSVFTARSVWLVMEISDNSREMENYDQPESHGLRHQKLVQDCRIHFFILSQLVCFLVTELHPTKQN